MFTIIPVNEFTSYQNIKVGIHCSKTKTMLVE